MAQHLMLSFLRTLEVNVLTFGALVQCHYLSAPVDIFTPPERKALTARFAKIHALILDVLPDVAEKEARQLALHTVQDELALRATASRPRGRDRWERL
jgi:hypothetical protein